MICDGDIQAKISDFDSQISLMQTQLAVLTAKRDLLVDLLREFRRVQ